jgi:hypothetical protein
MWDDNPDEFFKNIGLSATPPNFKAYHARVIK